MRPLFVSDPAFRVPRDGKDGPRGPAGESVKGEPGMQWAGVFSRRLTYKPGQVVGFEGSSYVCIRESVGREPTNTRYFQPVAVKGESIRGPSGPAGGRGPGSGRLNALQEQVDELLEGNTDLPSAVAETVIQRGQVVYIREDNGNLDLAKADAFATSVPVGIAADTVSAGQVCRFVPGGAVTIPEWNLEPGKVYFASDNVAGELTLIEPSDVGDYVLIILTAVSATTAIVEIHRAYKIGV